MMMMMMITMMSNAKTRNLDLGLPETLQFKLKGIGKQDLTLNLVENKRLNQNAPVYEVHTENVPPSYIDAPLPPSNLADTHNQKFGDDMRPYPPKPEPGHNDSGVISDIVVKGK
ncbi:hypothetical protein DPMN_000549 [Dreissena polymorpha]|uniref:Uncharacterized protein n=1 Tax=Dreissena polymorpha TaxID=45954 RepID=A0A9D4MID1_DREPO|nr:hypothetical protein DPMN_000549 [Dreissena polymorpha]